MACSIIFPALVKIANPGALRIARNNARIIGGILWKFKLYAHIETRSIANAEGHNTWRNLRSVMPSMF